MNVGNLIQENIQLIIVAIGVLLLLFIFVYRWEGFIILLEKTIGTVLQKLCSLAIEAFCLFFKIINALEIYIVLLIDALTGKATANGKIASLAIGVLSVASFYTTCSGMSVLVEEETIAFLITLGIQAILLSTSLLINDNLDFTQRDRDSWKLSGLLWLGLCGFGCMIAYMIPMFNLSYRIEKNIVHILYMIVIVAAVLALFKLIMYLVNAVSIRRDKGIFLVAIYFSVLSISSFFSYHSFVTVMYPDSVRNIDAFQRYKLGIIDLLEQVNENVDDAYYEKLLEELSVELNVLERKYEETDEEKLFLEDEREIYEKKNDYEKYIVLKKELTEKENELEKRYNDYKIERTELLNATIDVGPAVSEQLNNAAKRYESDRVKIEEEIAKIEDEIKNIDDEIKNSEEEYLKIVAKMDANKKQIDCSAEIVLVRSLLKQEGWSEKDASDFKKAVNKIEEGKLYLTDNSESGDLDNSLEKMAQVYVGYKDYKRIYSENYSMILGLSATQEEYTTVYDQIQDMVYQLLKVVPETSYIFVDSNNNVIQTKELALSNFYSEMEGLKRNANPELSQIEKNIRTFIDNKMVGILCALMAILIDMMILFVGIILPNGIHIPNNTNGKYTDEEIRKILSNLFNKPIGR